MKNRREFLKVGAVGGAAMVAGVACVTVNTEEETVEQPEVTEEESTPEEIAVTKPVVISTWKHGVEANEGAWVAIDAGGSALDAVEAGVKVTESDAENMSVGLGGLPDRDGKVTLDACIMNHKQQCGAVAVLENIENPISVARRVMEETPHVMLAGKGAYDFAIEKGFPHTNLLTPKAEKRWKEWLKDTDYQPQINSENHDTIGMLALDEDGKLSGACTTSGMAFKLHGRIGDSPIIGAGLFVDNEVGAACATGVGEAVIRVAGSAMVVELMRQGKTPTEACKEMVDRIMKTHDNLENMQVGFLALDKYGRHGGYSVYAGFNYAMKSTNEDELIDAGYELEWD